jgi:hypothetical protein
MELGSFGCAAPRSFEIFLIKASIKIGILLLCLFAVKLPAYVTSVILEYSIDDKVHFTLNGNNIIGPDEFGPFNYEVLSSSDGSFPIEDLNENGDNLFAVEDSSLDQYNMSVSYRLTIHVSNGDPIVVWSVPEQSKLLHLGKAEKNPLNWQSEDFDDSHWVPSSLATMIQGPASNYVCLRDEHFSGIFGTDPYVPRLSHIFNMNSRREITI